MVADSRNQVRGALRGADSSSLDHAAIDAAVTALGEGGADALAKAGAEGLPDSGGVIEWAGRLRRVVLLTRDLGLLRSEVPALAEMTLRILDGVELPAGKAAAGITEDFIATLPETRRRLSEDVEAAFEGDPAARSYAEIVAAYPAIRAIATYRLAHELHCAGVPSIPRIMTEDAHARTGIDIHPGATIGRRFFVDHGTGVVVGETCEIGDRVVLYQGVTLGALAPRKGQVLRGVKRHPTIEDDVTIYAGATILGGETVIGHGCVVGGNVWLTQSLPPCSKVQIEPPRLQLRRDGECEYRSEQLHWDI
jgi:serine O-acetyltransferase